MIQRRVMLPYRRTNQSMNPQSPMSPPTMTKMSESSTSQYAGDTLAMQDMAGQVEPLIGSVLPKDPAPISSTWLAGAGYMVCSSLMIIANKLAIHHMPAGQFVLFLQLAASGAVCVLLSVVNAVQLDPLEWSKIKTYIPAVVAFLGTIYCNIRTLQYCNVETFIVFRASTPIMVSVGDWLFLGRELPSYRSCVCLLVLVGGVCVYTVTDQGFEVKGYLWLAGWYVLFLMDQLYLKHVTNKVKHQSNWGRVYYLNTLSAAVLFVSIGVTQEWKALEWTTESKIFVTMSCVLGVAMSYYAFLARHAMSAASFTVLGNVCKILSVAINLLIWDKHANLPGLCALVLCLAAAYFYQQAPMRQR